MHLKFSLLALSIVTFSILAFSQSIAPTYTHKTDVIEGIAADLPSDGWYAFNQVGKPGLYCSPLTSFNPQVVPNTENDIVSSIDISDDGNWIVYFELSERKSIIIRKDGACKTRVPVYSSSGIGFYRGSPFGNELWFNDGMIGAVGFDFTDSNPEFKTTRQLYSESVDPWHAEWGIYKDQIFGLLKTYDSDWNDVRRTGFITIPNNGTGTADPSNVFKWANDPDTTLWGCGHTTSHDGELNLANSNGIGGPWVPNTKQSPTMDHKGFYITKFWREGVDSSITIDDQIDTYGTSINWCPAKFRFGTFDKVDFSSWSFANDKNFVIGSLKGELSPVWGIWVVEWKTNKWTFVTPDSIAKLKTTIFDDPALFFPSKSPVKRGISLNNQKLGTSKLPKQNILLTNEKLKSSNAINLKGQNSKKTIGRIPSGMYIGK